MEAKAIAKYVRMSPRKAGYICSLVRGKNVDEAVAILKYMPNRSASVIAKVINSAAANAENNNSMDREKLYVAEIYANQGPTLKRFMPRAQGRATGIRKRTSHIGVTVRER
ncbi:MAG: 50S ribosomal protein L22 [Peptostreptococcaceae bacterium]|nr:50S ribosomal protein L22 [Peptostreptococcaceae bacterium]